MGNSSSLSTRDQNALQEFYSAAFGKHLKFGGSATGGYASLEDYGNSLYSEGKEKLIRGIAKDVASMLKISSSFADTASIEKVVEVLSKSVPTKDKIIKADKSIHKGLCMALADSINKRYNMDIIDKSDSESGICAKVSEIMHSLFTGLHTEFLTVSGDVARIIKNLQVLQEYVDAANKKLIDLVGRTENSSEYESYKELYNALSKEINRQQTILANLTSAVIGPVGNSLITLLEENDDFKGLTSDLKTLTGTTEFGSKLSFLLNETANVTRAAEKVDKALKEIGLSLQDYKTSKDYKDLRAKIYKAISKRRPSEAEMWKLLAAADIINRNDVAHDDIVDVLNKKKGGAPGDLDITFADDAEMSLQSENDNPFKGRPESNRKSIAKQLEQKKYLRKQLFAVLNQQIKDKYNDLKFSLSKIAKKIGSSIEVSPELESFVKQLANFSNSQPDRKDIHIALSGYRKDMSSEWVKHQYMENLYAIAEAADMLAKSKNGEVFKDVKNCVDSLIDVILEFNANFAKTLTSVSVAQLGVKGGDCGCGGAEDEESERQLDEEAAEEAVEFVKDEMAEDADEGADADDVEGGAEGGMDADKALNAITALGGVIAYFSDTQFNHFTTIKKSIREVEYFYKIANIKKNMVKVSAEYDANVENYENILGEEAGHIIDQIQKKYNDLIKALEDDAANTGNGKLYAHGHIIPAGTNAELILPLKANIDVVKNGLPANDVKKVDSYVEGYKFLLEYIRSAKIEMLEAIQALDLYLSKFTKSMQMSPDQVKEFVQLLEQLEIVAKFFTDKSGDNLVGVYEAFAQNIAVNFPANINDYATLRDTHTQDLLNTLADTNFSITGDHYYTALTAPANRAPGLFYAARMMTKEQAINFVKQMEKAVKSVRSLENVINTFSKMNTEVSANVRTFMSAGYMFKAFMKYTIATSISVGYLSFDNNNMENFNNHYLATHAKMAVALKFNKNIFTIEGNTTIELLDPLTIVESPQNHDDICDKLFEMGVKSMITKVFTVVGSYTLFNRPTKSKTNYSLDSPLNPLRQILGGATGGKTDIIPDATELYIRLPLLVEWYKKVFLFNDGSQAVQQDYVDGVEIAAPAPVPQEQDNPLVSIIPDMDNVWGDLCRVIFIEAKNINDGAYPSTIADKIIRAVNDIYRHYTTKSKMTCKDILMEFVLEINRRYGYIMREEIQEYFREKYSYIDADAAYPADENVDYDLLDVEAQIGRRPAPSDRFRTFSRRETTRKFELQDLLKVAARFRQSVEQNLMLGAGAPTPGLAHTTLDGVIAEMTKNIKAIDSSDERYRVVYDQLHGVDEFSDVDQQKMLIFHETVITPLTVLYFTYLIVNDFNRFFATLNLSGADTSLNILTQAINRFNGNSKYKTYIEYNIAPANAGQQKYFDALMNLNEISVYATGAGVVNNTTLMEELLRRIMNIGCDTNGLTEVNFAKGTGSTYPYIDYTKLEEVCTALYNDAKSSLHRLRKFMPYTIIKKYEQGTRDPNNQENRISLFYIQEELFERLFNNKYGNGLTDANLGLKNTWNYLITAPGVSYDTVFSKLAFWDAADRHADSRTITKNFSSFPNGYLPLLKTGISFNNGSSTQRDVLNYISSNEAPAAAGPGVPDVAKSSNYVQLANIGTGILTHTGANYICGISDVYDIDDRKNADQHTLLGLLVKLNQLIYKYCNIMVDKSSHKIYRPLIEKFANGVNASDIFDSKNINDNVFDNGGVSHVFTTEPQPGAVLFASIANAIKQIASEQNERLTGSSPAYLEDSLLKVSEYQKELMRGYLPGFEKEFTILAKKAETLRRLLDENTINVDAAAVAVAGVNEPITKYTQANKEKEDDDTNVRKPYLITVLDSVAQSAKSILRCIIDVQKELNDVPMYFETYVDSIVDFNNRNGKVSLMPVSHITHLMNFSNSFIDENELTASTVNSIFDLSIIPSVVHGVGSPQFKFTYGTRGILSKQEPSLDFAPGVKSLLKQYNSKVGGAATFDDKLMSSLTKETIYISRWIVDYMYHQQVLCKHDWTGMRNLIRKNQQDNTIMPVYGYDFILTDPRIVSNLSCQTSKHAPTPAYDRWSKKSSVLALIENDDVNRSRRVLLECIRTGAQNPLRLEDRQQLRIYNILDMNIVPINLHAMQREVPFINILNYSYTFDQLVKNYFGDDTRDLLVSQLQDNINTDKTRDALVKFVAHPLGVRTPRDYVTNVYQLMNGTDTTKLGRPKYLSDQLWNKVLINTLYENDGNFAKPNYDIINADMRRFPGVPTQQAIQYSVNPTIMPALAVSNTLTYYNRDNVTQVNVGGNLVDYAYKGFLRYNSKLVRYLEWFTQLQRISRYIMRDELEWVQDPVVQGSDALAEEVTEFRNNNDVFSLEEYE
jgi:hypothetical protein